MVLSAYIRGSQPSSSSMVQMPVLAPSRMSSRLCLASDLYRSSCSTRAFTSRNAKIALCSSAPFPVTEKWISRFFRPGALSFT